MGIDNVVLLIKNNDLNLYFILLNTVFSVNKRIFYFVKVLEDRKRKNSDKASEREAEISGFKSRLRKVKENNQIIQSDISGVNEKLELLKKEKSILMENIRIAKESRQTTTKKNKLLKERLEQMKIDVEQDSKLKTSGIQGLTSSITNISSSCAGEGRRIESMQLILSTIREELSRKDNMVQDIQEDILIAQQKRRKKEEIKKKNDEALVAEEKRGQKVRHQLDKYQAEKECLETSIQDVLQENKQAELKTLELIQQRDSQRENRRRIEAVQVEYTNLNTVLGNLNEEIRTNEKIFLEKETELNKLQEEDKEERAQAKISFLQNEEVRKKVVKLLYLYYREALK